MFALLLFPQMPISAANGMIFLSAAVMLATLALYVPVFAAMLRE